MAGTYGDVPAPKIHYDRDGTIGAIYSSVLEYESDMSAANMKELNDFDFTGPSVGMSKYLILFFPRLMDIEGIFAAGQYTSSDVNTNMQWSPDTTNGVDGTWNNVVGVTDHSIYSHGTDPTVLRTKISGTPFSGAKAVRTRTTNGGIIYAWHLYGYPTSGENADRLELWHDTLDEAASGAHFDIGDVALSSSDTVDFRIKNLSDTFQANGIVVSPLDSAAVEFDTGSGFTSSVDIGDLAAGATSSVITARRAVPGSAGVGWWEFSAVPTSWT